MGLMGAIGAGIAEAGGAGAQIGMTQIKAAIEADRDARLSELRKGEAVHAAGVSLDTRQKATEQDIANAPRMRDVKVADAMATEQGRLDVQLDPTNVQAEAYKRGVLGEADAEVEVAKLLKKSTPEALKAAKEIAAATRDPAQQRLLSLQIAEAGLKLDESKAQAGERAEVRGLMGSARNVDMSQPGADEARQFYTKQAKEAEKGAQLAKGVDVDKADRATYLALAKEKYELATKEMDPERKDKLIRDGDAYAKAAEGKGETAGGGKPSEATAHSDAEKAIATGKITRDEANKRLVAAGLAPLPSAGARKTESAATGSKPAAAAVSTPTQDAEARIAEIEARLTAADKNKFTVGSGANEWMKNRIPPGERVRLERELRELRSGK